MALSQETQSRKLGSIKTPTNQATDSSQKEKFQYSSLRQGFSSRGKSQNGNKSPNRILIIHTAISYNNWEKVYVLRSFGRKSTIIQYLFHKWLFGELTKLEYKIFLTFPEVISNNMIYSALKARSIGHRKSSIRKVLESFSKICFPNKEIPSFEKWLGYRSFVLQIEEQERYSSPKKLKRYSGWRRHQNDQGSLAPPSVDPFFLEPEDENDNIELFFLLVEKVDLGQSEFLINHMRLKL